jgi:hypothetical protein
VKTLKKIAKEFHSLAWTLAGAVTVLITLSGDTRTMGMWISGVALAVHLLGIVFKKSE